MCCSLRIVFFPIIQVMKPLDVKTKFYNAESDEVFLEAQVKRKGKCLICNQTCSKEQSSIFLF